MIWGLLDMVLQWDDLTKRVAKSFSEPTTSETQKNLMDVIMIFLPVSQSHSGLILQMVAFINIQSRKIYWPLYTAEVALAAKTSFT